MTNLLNEKNITLDKLREMFHENDFSTMPVKDPSEYNEKELKLYITKNLEIQTIPISRRMNFHFAVDFLRLQFII